MVIIENSEREYQEFRRKCSENTTYKTAQAICNNYGYELIPDCYVEVYPSGKEVISFGVKFPADSKYLPDVHYYGMRNTDKDFRIQTSAVGSLSVDEHEEYIKAATAANNMVKELKQLDLSTLFRVDIEN